MVREGTMEKWIALEMLRLQSSFVAAPKPLHELLEMAEPQAPTRGGDPHRFDKEVLRRFDAALGPLDRRRLRLPMTFYVDKETPNDAYLQDPIAAGLLRALGEVPDVQMRDGRLWVGHVWAQALAKRHPSAFQFVFL